MATIIINSQDPLINNSRGLKRKRAGGVNFIATRPPAGSVSVESDGEDGFSDMVGDERADSELPEIFMDESPVTRKKRRGVQKVPMPPEHSGSQPTKKKYRCCFQGCEKAYTKPTRLAEHKRSHTGERPFKCIHPGCQNAYLRESHLQAHARTHRAYSERPFVCMEENCEKRFWTSTQLKVHCNTHDVAMKPFKCTEGECPEAFQKHHQWRAHIASVHCLPGTKTFRCDHEGCAKSFSTSQKLRAHSKVHQVDRYVCATGSCLAEPQYFQTWSLLQAHIRTAHPPTCPYPGCGDKKFASQKNFKAHLKVHEERDIQETIENGMNCDGSHDEKECTGRKNIEVGRDWKCEWEGCEKAFKSKKAMNVHINVSHREQRDFKCDHIGCGREFGYKHLLQRHMAKIHGIHSNGHGSEDREARNSWVGSPGKEKSSKQLVTLETSFIETLTGRAYKRRGEESGSGGGSLTGTRRVVHCPWPHFSPKNGQNEATKRDMPLKRQCGATFYRVYDLRRHLKADHALNVEKEELGAWLTSSPRL